MHFTGERYLPNTVNPQISYEHWHRYLLASSFVDGKSVLDIACGEGYGTNLLASQAKEIMGVDIDKESVEHAIKNYKKSNIKFQVGSAEKIPILGKHLFDVVISFETIEHLDSIGQDKFLKEIKRVLKPNGLLIMSSPVKENYEKIVDNPFHLQELTEEEFKDLMDEHFKFVRILGQEYYTGSFINEINQSVGQNQTFKIKTDQNGFSPATKAKDNNTYLLAICSNQTLSSELVSSFLYDPENKLAKNELVEINLFKEVNGSKELMPNYTKLIDLANSTLFKLKFDFEKDSRADNLTFCLLDEIGVLNIKSITLHDGKKFLKESVKYSSNAHLSVGEFHLFTKDTAEITIDVKNQEFKSILIEVDYVSVGADALTHLDGFINTLKEDTAASYEARLRKLNDDFKVKENEVEALKENISSKESLLEERQGVLVSLQGALESEKSDKLKIQTDLRNAIELEKNDKLNQLEKQRSAFEKELNSYKQQTASLNAVILAEKDERIKTINSLRANIEAKQDQKEKELLHLSQSKEQETVSIMKDLIQEIKEREDQIKIEKDERFKAIESLRTLLEQERIDRQNELKAIKNENIHAINNLREVKEKEMQEKQGIINQLHFNYENERKERLNDIEKLVRELEHYQSLYLAKAEEIEYAKEVMDYHSEETEYMKQVYQEREKDIKALRDSLSHKLGWTLTAPGRWIYNLAFRKNGHSSSKVVVDLALNGLKQPKQLTKTLNKDNLKTLTKALKTEDPRLILSNYKKLLARQRNGVNGHGAVNGLSIANGHETSLEIKTNPNRKNILFIAPTLPEFDESAGGKRALWMLQLMQQDYQVYVYTKGNKAPQHREQLEQDGIIIIDTHNFEQVKKRIRKFESIIYAWYYSMYEAGEVMNYYPEAKIIVDTVDVHWVREKRSLGNWEGVNETTWKENKDREVEIYKRADIIWAVSDVDKQAILEEVPNADIRVVSIIETINKEYYSDPKTNNILFLGGYRHYPNISAVKILADDIFPSIREEIPDAKLLIAGANATEEVEALGKREGIEFLGFIKNEEMEALYQRSFITIVPLIAGAGVKGKICEAISYGLPVVTNDIGNEGIGLESEKDAFITNDFEMMKMYAINAMQREYDLKLITNNAQKKFLDLVGPEVNKARMINSIQTQISICIVTYNKQDLLEKCIASILNNTNYPNYKILVWSNGCEDGTQDYLKALAEQDERIIPILSETNEVFVLPNNKMMQRFPNNDAVLLNNDVEVTENWLTALHDEAYSASSVGIVGSKILFPDGKLQEFGGELYLDGTGRNIGKWEDPDLPAYKESKYASFVSGCSFYIKKSTIEKLGVFDEAFHPCYCEDADFCYSAWENDLEVKVTPKSIIFHYEGGTAGTDTSSGFKKYQTINMKKFLEKHADNLEGINDNVRAKNESLKLVTV